MEKKSGKNKSENSGEIALKALHIFPWSYCLQYLEFYVSLPHLTMNQYLVWLL